MILHILTIAKKELRQGFRNAWTYTFLILLSLFTTVNLVLYTNIPVDVGFTEVTGSVINMTLYLLPLTTLLLGGFSVTTDKETGEWSLLSTYPISSVSFLWGKWLGLTIILMTMIVFSFGLSGLIIGLFGYSIHLQTFFFLLQFSIMLASIYLSIAILLGAIAKNRWQALAGGIAIWFLTVVIWPVLMISFLSFLPSYNLIKPVLQILTVINPAELIRVFSMIRLQAGTAFGAEYDQLISWVTSESGLIFFILIFLSWIVISITISALIWKRSEWIEQR